MINDASNNNLDVTTNTHLNQASALNYMGQIHAADVVEPVLRESTVQQPQAPKADVSSIINKWAAKS